MANTAVGIIDPDLIGKWDIPSMHPDAVAEGLYLVTYFDSVSQRTVSMYTADLAVVLNKKYLPGIVVNIFDGHGRLLQTIGSNI